MTKFVSITMLSLLIVMAGLWLQAEARIVHKIWDIDEPVSEKVVRCRITCLEKFLLEDVASMAETTDACSNTPDCFMCWDFCKILQLEQRTIGNLMCTNPTCLMGCKYACFYHDYLPWLNVSPVAPIVLT